jgi:hypothetical protein
MEESQRAASQYGGIKLTRPIARRAVICACRAWTAGERASAAWHRDVDDRDTGADFFERIIGHLDFAERQTTRAGANNAEVDDGKRTDRERVWT